MTLRGEDIPLWIQVFIKEMENEFGDETWPIHILENEARVAVWMVTSLMGVNSRGIPAQACRLAERYLNTRFCELGTRVDRDEELPGLSVADQLPLIIVSCVQLSSKMCSAKKALQPSTLYLQLANQGLKLKINDIKCFERHVYSTLGFHLPLLTSVDVAEMLAIELGLSSIYCKIGTLVNLAEFNRDKINKILNCVKEKPTCIKSNINMLRTLHLAAGVVAAAALWYIPQSESAVAMGRLARLTKAPLVYIKCVATIIKIKIIPLTVDGEGSLRKKKRFC